MTDVAAVLAVGLGTLTNTCQPTFSLDHQVLVQRGGEELSEGVGSRLILCGEVPVPDERDRHFSDNYFSSPRKYPTPSAIADSIYPLPATIVAGRSCAILRVQRMSPLAR